MKYISSQSHQRHLLVYKCLRCKVTDLNSEMTWAYRVWSEHERLQLTITTCWHPQHPHSGPGQVCLTWTLWRKYVDLPWWGQFCWRGRPRSSSGETSERPGQTDAGCMWRWGSWTWQRATSSQLECLLLQVFPGSAGQCRKRIVEILPAQKISPAREIFSKFSPWREDTARSRKIN